MSNLMRNLVLVACLVATSTWGATDKPKVKPANADPRAVIVTNLNLAEVKLEDIHPTPSAYLYEVKIGNRAMYVTADGKFLVKGDMFDLVTRKNLTEEANKVERRKLFASLDESKMIVFSPEHPKYTVTVFTDVDCSYCRKMHSEIAELNALGIRVRYLAYPRSGPNTESWKSMEAVWCAKDPRDAITRAKKGEKIEGTCDTNPVAKQYEIGGKLGMSGTPGVFDEEGTMVGGYVPAKELAALLDSQKQAVAAAK